MWQISCDISIFSLDTQSAFSI